jgi:hypothetical protein
MLVITSSMLLAIMGLGATRYFIARKNLANTTDFTEARFYALGHQIGMNIISSDSNWRTNYANGPEIQSGYRHGPTP